MPKQTIKPLLFILLFIGLIWARSSLGKFMSGTFIQSLGTTLSKIVDKNPYPWFKGFLQGVVIPNSSVFGFLIFLGEFLTAIAIIVGSAVLILSPKYHRDASLILIAGLVGGAFLNIMFWLGFGYTSPSTDGLNLLMAVIQIIGVVTLIKNR